MVLNNYMGREGEGWIWCGLFYQFYSTLHNDPVSIQVTEFINIFVWTG